MSLRNVGLSPKHIALLPRSPHPPRKVTPVTGRKGGGRKKKQEQNDAIDARPLNSVIKLHGGPTYGHRGLLAGEMHTYRIGANVLMLQPPKWELCGFCADIPWHNHGSSPYLNTHKLQGVYGGNYRHRLYTQHYPRSHIDSNFVTRLRGLFHHSV
jgi:hypothetical protein